MEREDIAAAYLIGATKPWVDLPEAKPRARARLGQEGEPETIFVSYAGTIEHSEAVMIDRYEDEKYADVRAEGETRRTVKEEE